MEQTQTNQTVNDINDTTGFMGKISPTYLKALEINAKNLTQKNSLGSRNEIEIVTPDSKVSSLIDSPPPLTESSSDKGIKDFTR